MFVSFSQINLSHFSYAVWAIDSFLEPFTLSYYVTVTLGSTTKIIATTCSQLAIKSTALAPRMSIMSAATSGHQQKFTITTDNQSPAILVLKQKCLHKYQSSCCRKAI